MTLTIELPEGLAARLAELLPEDERVRFAASAIEDALDARLRDSAECVSAVEQALADMNEGRNLIPFDEVCRQWEAERTALNHSTLT